MSKESASIPRFSQTQASRLAFDLYSLRVEALPLPSYSDQNFLLRSAEGERWVLKVSNATEDRAFLEAQIQALRHLGPRLPPPFRVPAPRPTPRGDWLVETEGEGGERYAVRLLSFLEGEPMARVTPWSGELLAGAGRLIASVDAVLGDFDHPALHRYSRWDLQYAADLRPLAAAIEPPRRRVLAESLFARFEEEVVPALGELPRSLCHNDGNDHNLLVTEVDGKSTVTGLIDFGDLAHTPRVFSLAIAAAYAMLRQRDPLAAAEAVCGGYSSLLPVSEAELEVLPAAIRCRLAASVTLVAEQVRERRALGLPDDPYLTVTTRPGWEALERLAGMPAAEARRRLARACGLAPALDLGAPELGTPSAEGAVPDPEAAARAVAAARRRHVAPSFSLAYRRPLEIVRGWMQYLYDRSGRAYLDGVNNVCHVGHCHPRVVEAARRQMGELNTNTRYLHELLPEYAARLVACLPDPLSVCYLVTSGSEANDLALRLARTHTGRRGVVVLEGAYHGHTTSLIELSPYKFDGPGGAGISPHVRQAVMPDPFRQAYPRADPEAGRRYARHVAEAAADLARSEHGLAAFFCEPLLGCGGQVVPPAGYLQHAFEHVRRLGGLAVADEVQVGFGRVGSHFWAFETQGVVPDIVTLGKPIGNGHPMAAVVTTPEIAASFANGMEYFNTFGGNPVSAAVGLAVLDAIEEESLQRHALEVGAYVRRGLETLAERHPLVGEVRGLGLFLGVELVRDPETLEPAAKEAADVVEHLRDAGILLSTDGPLENVLKIKPPLPFAEENADHLIAALGEALAAVEAG